MLLPLLLSSTMLMPACLPTCLPACCYCHPLRKCPSASMMAPPVHLPADFLYDGAVMMDNNLDTRLQEESWGGLGLQRGE